jgi:hypothetical protein
MKLQKENRRKKNDPWFNGWLSNVMVFKWGLLLINHQRVFLDSLWENIFERKQSQRFAWIRLPKDEFWSLNIQTSKLLKSILQIQNLKN